MNDRERILTLLRGGTPDRVPWFGDLDWWAYGMEKRGEVPPDFRRSEAYFQLYRELGVGFYLQGYEPFQAVYDESVQISEETQGHRRRRIVHTPVGTLSEEWTYLPGSFTEAPTTHFIKSPADLPVFRYWIEHTEYRPLYDEAKRRYGLVKDLGVVLCYLPKSPFMQLVVYMAGIQTVVNLWAEARRELEETLKVLEHKTDEAAAIALASPAECLMIPENLSAEVVGPRFYSLYMHPYEEKWTRRIAEAGKHSFVHMDGTLRGLIGPVARSGFQVIEAVTPAPVGDLTFPQMREMVGPETILWGGIPGVYFTEAIDDAEFERLIREVLQVMTTAPKYVLGVADQVPPNALRRRVARVVELVERYGVY